ncbi:MAG: membrane fusion protein (multidrug efflux system) [Pseudomonadales bacterium]
MKTRSLVALLSALLILSACSGEDDQAPPAIEVVVTDVQLLPYQRRNSYVGRLEAAQDVTIQAKVSGYLKQRFFAEGQHISKGAKLYAIDPATFEASKEQAEAEIESGKAKVKVATRNYQRGEQLVTSGVISASQMDELEGTYFEAIAALKAAEAIYDKALINFNDTIITAPISGQIGRSKYYVGDLVNPESGELTTIVNTQTVNAVFSINQKMLLLIHQSNINEEDLPTVTDVEVLIELSDDSIYPHKGALDFLDNRIDEATGTVRVTAIIPNPDGYLRHGQYVRVIVQAAESVAALMIPQATVQSDQLGNFVLVVSPNNVVNRAEVELGERVDEKVIVIDGLSEGQRLILQGIQKVRIGQTVRARDQVVSEPESSIQQSDSQPSNNKEQEESPVAPSSKS